MGPKIGPFPGAGLPAMDMHPQHKVLTDTTALFKKKLVYDVFLYLIIIKMFVFNIYKIIIIKCNNITI